MCFAKGLPSLFPESMIIIGSYQLQEQTQKGRLRAEIRADPEGQLQSRLRADPEGQAKSSLRADPEGQLKSSLRAG